MRGRAVLVIAIAGCGRLSFDPTNVGADGNAPDARVRCTLTDSGPIVATADGQVIENLHITAPSGTHGIEVDGFTDVIIRNVEIEYSGMGGEGIHIGNAPRARIENASIGDVGAPPSGMTATGGNIAVLNSSDVTITHVRLRHGAENIYADFSPRLTMQFIEGYDVRRNENVTIAHSDDALLEDFSFVNPATAWTSGVIQIYETSNATIRRGLVDGDNEPSGGGVKFNANGTGAVGGLVEDVDAIHQGNACFNAWSSTDITFRRTTCRDNICTDQGRGLPASGGMGWSGGGTGTSTQVLRLEASSFFQLCGQTFWPPAAFTEQELAETDVPARAPLAQQFCFDP